MDFVYIVKHENINEDLRYSLRSIAKFYPDHKVWIVGYKPTWVQNVGYLPVKQTRGKWKNSIKNIQTACECEEISEDFILMNDDFFVINPELYTLEEIANSNLNLLDKSIEQYKKVRGSAWRKAFSEVKKLLKALNVPGPYYSYEAHLPLQINRAKYLEVMNLPEVQAFMKTSKVLHKRTLYKNYDKPEKSIVIPTDIKVYAEKDTSLKKLNVCGWLSVIDGVVKNPKFKDLNRLLRQTFPDPCKYEITSNITKNLEKTIPQTITLHKKKRDFINKW